MELEAHERNKKRDIIKVAVGEYWLNQEVVSVETKSSVSFAQKFSLARCKWLYSVVAV